MGNQNVLNPKNVHMGKQNFLNQKMWTLNISKHQNISQPKRLLKLFGEFLLVETTLNIDAWKMTFPLQQKWAPF